MTTLTDEELMGMYSEPRSDAEMIEYGREVEAAVLAKLREQEPVAWRVPVSVMHHNRIVTTTYQFRAEKASRLDEPLYAAPLPAVVQVPPGYKLVPVGLLERLAPEDPMNQDEMGGCVWCAGNGGKKYGDAGRDPADHAADCPWLEARAMLAAAPEATAQGEQAAEPVRVVLQALSAARLAMFSMGEHHQEIAADCVRLIDKARSALSSTDRQPSVPAQWREAVKVAREALDWANDALPESDWPETSRKVHAALAQLDALEGGE